MHTEPTAPGRTAQWDTTRERRVTALALRLAFEFPNWRLGRCYETAETVADISVRMADELAATRRGP